MHVYVIHVPSRFGSALHSVFPRVHAHGLAPTFVVFLRWSFKACRRFTEKSFGSPVPPACAYSRTTSTTSGNTNKYFPGFGYDDIIYFRRWSPSPRYYRRRRKNWAHLQPVEATSTRARAGRTEVFLSNRERQTTAVEGRGCSLSPLSLTLPPSLSTHPLTVSLKQDSPHQAPPDHVTCIPSKTESLG